MTDDYRIRDGEPRDREVIEAMLSRHFASARLVTRGVLHDAGREPALVAESNDAVVGVAVHRDDGEATELLALVSERAGAGIGRSLIEEVAKRSAARGKRKLVVCTTNDNLTALRLYQRNGFEVSAVNHGAIAHYRRLKPEIPKTGLGGARIRDEIVLTRPLANADPL